MTLRITQFVLVSMLAVACGKKEDNSLEGKKAKLEKWKTEVAALTDSVRNLEKQIAQLDPNAKSEIKVKPVSVSPVELSTFKHFVSVQGNLEAEENVMVSSKMPGMITAVLVKEGDFVSKGQLLATLDDEIIRKSIDEVKTSLDLVNTLYEKQKALWDQKIGTETQFLNLKNQKESLENKLVTLNSQKSQAKVLAPFSGVVDNIISKQGTMASPGVPILQLVNTTDLKVVAKVPDSYVSLIKNGDFVQIEFPDLGKTVDARVTNVARIVDPMSRTFKVEVKMPSASQEFKPNLLAVIRINDKTAPGTIVVDENIVQLTEEGKIVFVANGESGKQKSVSKKVTTGLSYNGKVQIISGLEPGEKLITTGYQDLVNDQPISF